MLAAFVGQGQRTGASPAPSSCSRSPLSRLRLSPDLLKSQRLAGCGWSLGIKEKVETEDGARRCTSGIKGLVKPGKQSPVSAGSESPGRAEQTPRFLTHSPPTVRRTGVDGGSVRGAQGSVDGLCPQRRCIPLADKVPGTFQCSERALKQGAEHRRGP